MDRSDCKVLNQALKTAQTAARSAGRIIRNRAGGGFRVDHKGATDMVTEVDLAAEEEIIAVISAAFPSHRLVAEESGEGEQESEYTWWIDPLDGTTNYIHGYPRYSVSIALARRARIVLGVVFDPLRDEMFFALQGRGAYLNDRRIQVSSVKKLSDSLLATGFPYVRSRRRQALALAARFLEQIHGLRRDGSAALDLAAVAAGQLDGYWEFGLKPWDTAAGLILVEEAGGKVSGFGGEAFDFRKGDIVAGNRFIQGDLLKIMGEEE